jgi:hypothetical protein
MGVKLGRTVAYVYTTEFQKRGLPHVHMLCILDPDDKPNSTQDIDNLASAKTQTACMIPEFESVHSSKIGKLSILLFGYLC